jgi:hypothetical protein
MGDQVTLYPGSSSETTAPWVTTVLYPRATVLPGVDPAPA